MNRSARVALTAAVMSGLSFFAGCDNAGGPDRAAIDDVSRAAQSASGGDEQLKAAVTRLQGIAGNSELSASIRAHAKTVLGQLLVRSAREKLRTVDRLDLDALRLSLEMAQLAGQMQAGQVMVQGYGKLDPAATVRVLGQKVAEAQGGADKPVWFEEGSVKVPSLGAVAQSISQYEGTLAARTDEIRGLEQQRAAALQMAEKFAAESETLSGRPAVEAFTKSSEARKEAGVLSAKLDVANASLDPLRRDLAVASAQRDFIAGAIKQYEEESKTLQASWAETQKAIAAQSALSKGIATSAGATATVDGVDAAPGGSMNEKGEKLAQASAKADELRQSAVDDLTEAVKHLGDAARSAQEASTEAGRLQAERQNAGPGEITAWKLSQVALSPSSFKLQQADAQRLLASVHSSRAASLDVRKTLAGVVGPAMQASGVAVPAAVGDAGLAKATTEALAQADEAFTAADEILKEVAEGRTANDLEKAAVRSGQTQRVFVLYNWAQLAADMGKNDQAKAHMDASVEAGKLVIDSGGTLTGLPADLAARLTPPPAATEPSAPTTDETKPEAEQPKPDAPAGGNPG